jgi:hypothetical protein
MANTFTRTTKSSLSTADVTSSATTNILTVVNGATLVVLSILLSNKTGSAAYVNVYLVPSSGDAVFLIKNAPVPAGSTLEIISGNKVILTSTDVIRASSDTASALDATVSYLQQT